MDPKVILMPVYSRGNEIERLRGALSLARHFNAHLKVIFAQSKPSDLLGTELFALSATVREQVTSIMDGDANQNRGELRENFEQLCNENHVVVSVKPEDGLPTASWYEINGARSELVAVHGRVSDLIVIPHSKSGDATATFEEAILHTGRPVFLVPRGMREIEITKALIGWDGGLECTKAVRQALPFLKRASGVIIGARTDTPSDRPTARDAADYLAYHGVSAEIQLLDEKAASTGAALLNLATGQSCDLLVTGAYAHTRLRHRLLGGVTSHMLKHAEIPVLMAH
ncbi:universal stress protein [Shimia abyssi]|uniref:Universal stress protein family protein n=1 Tax=Shimia abyssi TaxID=1662395 RepID=A0A2P8EWH0_9RHOB|nr:universal stress protein [Shimia abyssi]PSL13813.1 universal stress protein family protein [Shimia abyssi]